MPAWITNPHAAYVLAAYAVAAVGLIGLLIVSVLAARKADKAWRKLSKK
jgi:heme exporter protein CcmD